MPHADAPHQAAAPRAKGHPERAPLVAEASRGGGEPRQPGAVKTLWRSNCAVDYFVVLSGFVTHWASRGAFVSTAGDGRFGAAAASWLARRFGRVLASTYLSMAVAVLLMSAEGDACNCVMMETRQGAPAFGHVARCAVLMEPWLSPSRWCPNGQVWTVAALAPAWLLYPAIFDRAFFNRPRRCLWAAAALLAALPTGADPRRRMPAKPQQARTE
ncbi:hypothetical protein M885DRAFT_563705 [Pelagophyceae sp. CCMP2097]|nr:hypothetical protein M885DRAFT_563705 [Pelagophyceae sp. CCMP2097]